MSDNSAPRLTVWDGRWAQDREAWERAWDGASGGDVFSHPAYLLQFADDDHLPRCAFFTSSTGENVMYAFLQRPIRSDACGHPIHSELSDIVGPLRYGGPLGRALTEVAAEEFWSSFRAWARASGVVSEFVRLDPVQRGRVAYPGEVREHGVHIVREIGGFDESGLLADMRPNVRRGFRKARASNLTTLIDETGEYLEDFLRIYGETMERTGGSPRFLDTRSALRTIHTALPGRFAYVYAVADGEPVSVNLLLLSDTTGYFYLGGTLRRALPLYASVLAQVESVLYIRARGLHDYVLTGGMTADPGDELLRFKRGFAPRGEVMYFTGTQVFDHDAYARLACCVDPRTCPHFPVYRAPARGRACRLPIPGAGDIQELVP